MLAIRQLESLSLILGTPLLSDDAKRSVYDFQLLCYACDLVFQLRKGNIDHSEGGQLKSLLPSLGTP